MHRNTEKTIKKHYYYYYFLDFFFFTSIIDSSPGLLKCGVVDTSHLYYMHPHFKKMENIELIS